MTDKIIVVTPPDDVLQLGFRVLAVDLTTDQLNHLSLAVQELETSENIIVFVWKLGSDINWVLDKTYKSNAIIFNADSIDQTLIGFLAGKKKSAYFGDLKSLKEVNKSVLHDKEHCIIFLNNFLGSYE
jgi:hypothetical protein